MMKQEFEELAGYEVSYTDYTNIIEPMYIAADIDKRDFVKCINKKRFALKKLSEIRKEMQQIAQKLKDTCTHYTDYEAKQKLDDLINEYISRKYYGTADYLITEKELFTCYYPTNIDIYSKNNYKTYETIDLF